MRKEASKTPQHREEVLIQYFRLKRSLKVLFFKVRNREKENFECPVCGYEGPFMDIATVEGPRKHAKCPNRTALERHRIQFVVLHKF